MPRSQLLPLILSALLVVRPGAAAGAQAATSAVATPRSTLNVITGGQTLSLYDVHVLKGIPAGTPAASAASPTSTASGVTNSATAPAAHHGGQIVIDVASAADSIITRLSDDRKCVVMGRGEACRFEAALDVADADGAHTSSYDIHGAWVAGLAPRNHAKGATTVAARITLQYDDLEAMPAVAAASAGPTAATSAAVTTTSAGAVASGETTAPKKHRGFGKFVVGLVRDHGVQALEIATGVGALSMMTHNLSMAGAARGGLGGPSQSEIMSLAHAINTTPGTHQINLGMTPGAGRGGPADLPAALAYSAIVRQQLIAQGVDPSRFTIASAGAAQMSAQKAGTTP